MSVGRSLLGKFGFIGAMKPKIVSLKSVLRLVQPSIRRSNVGAARLWASESSSREFQGKELARRAFNESLVRLHVAR